MKHTQHLNIESISEYIKDKEDFAVVTPVFKKDDWRNSEKPRYFISPVSISRKCGFLGREGCVFDNLDINGNVIMTKEEMILNFGLTFGKTVKYEMDENFDADVVCEKNGPYITNFRKI